MKRDMDLIRRIMLEIEKQPFDGGGLNVEIAGVTDAEVTYHLILLSEAGLIEGRDVSSLDGPGFLVTRLTYSGHEFLDAARNDAIWLKAKELAMKAVGSLTMEGLKIALSKVVESGLNS